VSDCSATERWLPIPGYEGFYEVSDLGRIRSIDRVVPTIASNPTGPTRTLKGKIRATTPRAGYPSVRLSRDGVIRIVDVHVVVLTTFQGPPPREGMFCLHENDIRTDCRLSNLRWGTQRDNKLDEIRNGNNGQLSKTRCPRGHLYAGPNLIRSFNKLKDGSRSPARECRSCKSTLYAIFYERRKGYPESDFDSLADAKYEQIMRGETAR
jgi:hypothetical protein